MIKTKKPTPMGIYQRYALTGAAIGLYFGFFYQPSGDPDYGIAIILSVLAALVTVVIHSWKKHLPMSAILKDFFDMLILYLVFLLALAFRHVADNLGGRPAVILVTTITGIGLGLFLAQRTKASIQK
jgi:disulfide bond formation protein DsbB